jgi:hypothetical protein
MKLLTQHLFSAVLLQLACASEAQLGDVLAATAADDAAESSSSVPQSVDTSEPCSTNQECIERYAGEPYVCRKSNHRCAGLLNRDCPSYLGDWADVQSDDAIYLGLLVVDDLNGAEGEAAVELARSEIQHTLGGGVSSSATSPGHPLVIISCNTDGAEPLNAVRHLTQDIEVSALLGGFLSSNVLSLAPQYTIPSGVLQIAPSATADPISALDDRDLVYRAQIPGEILFQVLTPFLDRVIQPAIYADGIAGTGEPIRVMMVYDPDGSGVYQAATIAKYLSVNGQPVPRSGSPFYRELRLEKPDPLDPQPLSVAAARSIIDFQPHFIIYQTQDASILRSVESGWPPGATKPYFIVSAGFSAQLPSFVGADAALRKRAFSFLGLPEGFNQANFERWAEILRSSSGLTRPISRVYGPNLYDSLYMLAYAISTLGEQQPTGLNLVPGFRRLGGPGVSIPFGPTEMPKAMAELAAGRNIDYVGVNGVFHYTPQGDRAGLAAIGCLTTDEAGNATGLKASGFVYDTETQQVDSELISCP